MNGISALIRETPESSPVLFPPSQQSVTQKRAFSRTLILDFWSAEVQEINFRCLYYFTARRNKVLIHAAIWMNLKNKLLSDRSQI